MLPACKNKQEVAATAADENPTETSDHTDQSGTMISAEADETTKAVEADMDTETADTIEAEAKPINEEGPAAGDQHSMKKEEGFPENAVARIQRTPCFGRCPIYTITVYEDGSVIYEAEEFVQEKGAFYGKVEEDKIRKLMQRAEAINFFELNDEYDNEYVTDLPSTITTLRKDGELKQVINRYQGPEELHKFEKYFDQLFLDLNWSSPD